MVKQKDSDWDEHHHQELAEEDGSVENRLVEETQKPVQQNHHPTMAEKN